MWEMNFKNRYMDGNWDNTYPLLVLVIYFYFVILFPLGTSGNFGENLTK